MTSHQDGMEMAVKTRPSGRLASLTDTEGRFEIQVSPDVPACLLAANQAVLAGNLSEAREHLCAEHLERVDAWLDRNDARTDVMFILAKLLWDVKRFDQAETWFRRILDIEPHAHVYDYLSRILMQHERTWGEAAEFSRLACEAAPGEVSFREHWARNLVRLGRTSEGIDEFRQAHLDHPEDAAAHSNYLWFAQYSPEISYRQINQGYCQWASRWGSGRRSPGSYRNSPDPQRRLRIGYLSPNFRRHSVSYFIEPVLEGRDARQVEVFGYGNVSHPDATTTALKPKFDHYRDIWNQDAQTVCHWIEQDRIDILVEIAGHVVDQRMDVMAGCPAPVQVDLGGVSTTGMPQIDYRITDAVYDPPEVESCYAERCLYLPGGLSCFRPPRQSPAVGPLPAQTRGGFTFGSCNNLAKMSGETLAMWSRILQAVPPSRMLLKFGGAQCPDVQERLLTSFERHGVAPDRIEFAGWSEEGDHLGIFHRMDLLLDTYPYNGGITTLEGLWMGVPVVTLSGDKFVSRAGLSILKQVGLEVFAASSAEEYVNKAVSFAGQTASLAAIRQSLRMLMLRSPICDPGRMSRELTGAYRWMWQQYCQARAMGRPL